MHLQPALPHCWTRDELRLSGNYVGCYLTASYLYYLHPEERPICDDATFDWVCQELLSNWDKIEHMHKHLLSIEELKAGTGFHLSEKQYPNIVKSVAMGMSRYKSG